LPVDCVSPYTSERPGAHWKCKKHGSGGKKAKLKVPAPPEGH
jgi:hypothetical protein